MRLVEKSADFMDALASAKGEAKTAFGNQDVLVEKFVSQPRHIEVQVFGDGEKAVHLFERDCSLQRRHQKVIEEAPAPGMTKAMRESMGQAAVRAAETIGYKGAGTVEFIVDGSQGLQTDGFWFMEMNTRLQVEHPVTEAITGVDLVEWQLRVASGEGLPKTQDELSISGHSFEARLYAEDVPKGFLPATGTLTHLKFGPEARADSGVRTGDTISPFYDPMIAKLITHGPTREIALKKMSQALRETEVGGTVTNLAFLGALCDHDGFSKGEVDTGLIGRNLDDLVVEPVAQPRSIAQAAMAALGLMAVPAWDRGFALWQPEWHRVVLEVAGRELEVFVMSLDAVTAKIRVEESEIVARWDDEWRFDGNNSAPWIVSAGVVTIFADYGLSFHVVDPLDRGSAAHGSGDLIEAPMPGLVKAVFTSAGSQVKAGDRMAVLEAMKMEHSLLAVRDGVVAEVMATVGLQVEAGAALIRLEDLVEEDAS